MKTEKKSIKKRASKAIVTQDNRFIYAKYDMNANEMKFFMWIVAQLNSQKDQLFQVCEIPLSEIFQIFNHTSDENYTYVKNLIDSMAKKAYIEDFKLLDEKTMKEVDIHRAMPLFQFIEYKRGEAFISYKLNDCLMQYFLDQKRDFTQLKFSDIQQMKSAYSIRIYNMLICELKQNRQSLKMNLAVLQNILEVPKVYIERWIDFKRFVLDQAQKDINTKSNLILLDIKTFKTGRKITDLEFIFDYKLNDKRIQRDQEKQESFNEALIKAIESYVGKSVHFRDYGKLECMGWKWENEEQKRLFAIFRKSDEKLICFLVKNFKDINSLQRAREKAEEMFYLDTEAVKAGLEFKKKLEQGSLFNLNSLLSPKK